MIYFKNQHTANTANLKIGSKEVEWALVDDCSDFKLDKNNNNELNDTDKEKRRKAFAVWLQIGFYTLRIVAFVFENM